MKWIRGGGGTNLAEEDTVAHDRRSNFRWT